MEDYKKLWENVCEEKKQLQIENHRLKKDSQYWRAQSNKFERLFNKVKLSYN